MNAPRTADTTRHGARPTPPPAARRSSEPPLTPESERELVARWAAGDRAAGQRLLKALAPFVRGMASTYRRSRMPLEDLVQEGNIGLLKAAARFDAERGTRLTTYAAYWVRAQIHASLQRGNGAVSLGTSKNERRAVRLYRKTREEDPAAFARMSGITERHAVDLLPLLIAPQTSLDHAPTEDGRPLVERLAGGAPSPEETASLAEEQHRVRGALAAVLATSSPRERSIVEERWLRDEPKTLEQLSAEFGVSKAYVHQLEQRARARVRGHLTGAAAAAAPM